MKTDFTIETVAIGTKTRLDLHGGVSRLIFRVDAAGFGTVKLNGAILFDNTIIDAAPGAVIEGVYTLEVPATRVTVTVIKIFHQNA